MKVPFIDLKIQYKKLKKEMDLAVLNILENGEFIMGRNIEDFENTMSKYLKIRALACASGSDALLLALMAEGIGKGDEVITTPFTFFATAGAVARLGAKPVFVDIDERTFNIDAKKVKKAITKKTKAIIPVHLFGQPANMSGLYKAIGKNKIVIIEDACQSIGAEYKGKKVGSIGDYGCFSFFPTKNLGAGGDGGLIVVKDNQKFEKIRMLRLHGAKSKYFHEYVGINSRLDSIQAAILSVKIKYLNKWNNQRRKIAKIYTKNLKDVVITPYIMEDAVHVFHQYAILTPKRDELLNYLKEKEISAGVYYPLPLHLQKCFSYLGYKKGDFPVSEKISEQILSLPIYPQLTQKQIKYIINSVKSFFDKKSL